MLLMIGTATWWVAVAIGLAMVLGGAAAGGPGAQVFEWVETGEPVVAFGQSQPPTKVEALGYHRKHQIPRARWDHSDPCFGVTYAGLFCCFLLHGGGARSLVVWTCCGSRQCDLSPPRHVLPVGLRHRLTPR